MTLPEPLKHAVEELGFENPTAIQALALPHLLEGRDLAGQAQTGTGKTACFLLGVMTRLLEGKRRADGLPRALIVAPTRELALQIASDATQLALHTDLEIVTCYGGTAWAQQANAVREGTDIVVGTPGRLIDYIRQDVLKLNRIESFVLDEADRMFDMGFIRDVNFLFRRIPPKGKRQAMLFSATLSEAVMRLATRFMRDPVEVAVQPEQRVVEAIEQCLYHVSSTEKVNLLLGLLKQETPQRAMIFVNTKRDGEALCWKLNHNGFPTVYMSGDIPQKKRQRIITALKEGKIDLLVATDVASRGLHVDDVTHVFNYDVPQDPEDYVHRIGRTARAGASGKAITLACEDWVTGLPAVELFIAHKIPSNIPTDELIAPDRSPRFRRVRGKTYCGWPPGSEIDDSATGGDKPRDKERSRRGKKPRREQGHHRQDKAPRQQTTSAPAPEHKTDRPKRQRKRRKIEKSE